MAGKAKEASVRVSSELNPMEKEAAMERPGGSHCLRRGHQSPRPSDYSKCTGRPLKGFHQEMTR